ncbi:TonB-dependent siderophore receptor [Pigmentiphaga aceris]|nr:TonB-dependent siderophore receptor [Pigmentiphaga aceris]
MPLSSGARALAIALSAWAAVAAAPAAHAQTAPPATTNRASTLPVVTVEDTAETATAPTVGYVVRNSSSGTKTDTPIVETAQSISTVTRDQIREQNAQSLNQMLRYTPGVAVETRGATATRLDQFTVRGFSASSYLDGLRNPGSRDALPQVDGYRLERIDVLKGPSSVMYGQGGPGGIVNMISKRPTEDGVREIQFGLGNYSNRSLGFDYGDRLDKEGKLLFRVTGLAYAADGQIDHTKERRYFIAPSFTWKATPDTTLTVLANFQRDPDMGSYGAVPGVRSLYRAPDGYYLPSSFYDGDANFEKSDRKNASIGYQFDHRFNDTFSFHQGLRYQKAEGIYRSIYSGGYADGAPNYSLIRRSAIATNVEIDAFTIDQNLQAKFATGPLSHTALVGFDYQRTETSTLSGSGVNGGAPALNVFRPNNFMQIPVPAFTADALAKAFQSGLYVQDQMKFGRLTATLGGRYDWSTTSNTTRTIANNRVTSTGLKQEAFSGRASLLYLFDNGIAPYASYSESFEPQSGTGFNGQPFEPIRGKQNEIGVKYQPVGSRSLFTAALYDVRRKNTTTTDPDPTHLCNGARCNIAAGEVRTRGLELEARTEPVRGLSLIAGYSYSDNVYTKDNSAVAGVNLEGKTPGSLPTHQASAWARYQVQEGPLAGVGFGAGLRYVGSTYTSTSNLYKTPSRVLVDALLDVDLGRVNPQLKGWNASLNISNLFDKTHVASCLGDFDWCYYGYQRAVKANVRYTF